MWGRVTGCRLCVVEVGDLLEDDAVAVELVRDVSVALDERRHLEPEARQQPHLAEEADEAVGEVDAEQLVGVVAVDLHQLPRELHRQPGRLVLQVAFDLLAPVGVLRVRVVDHVVLELLHLPLEPPDRLQVGEEQRRRRRHLGRLRLQLLRQHDVTHHLRQVLARRAESLRRRRARLELLTQRLGLLLELAEQPLARRSELLEDERPRSELFVPHELAQQRVALEARRREARV